jgi:pimeloyl-ACP methyl ester carboxylesterase
MTQSFMDVDGARLEVRRWPGRPLPILMLHEGLGSVSMWRDFPEQLAAATGHEVICWSRRGYGFSDSQSEPFEPDYMHRESELLPEIMRALELEVAHLFGHSDGGSIALLSASRFPHLVAALILEAPHVFVEPVTLDSIRAVRAHFESGNLGGKLARHHADADLVFWCWNDIWLDDRFRAWSIESCLSAVGAPALLIQGLDDEYGTLSQLDCIEKWLPRTERLILPECGHSPHRDKTIAVLEASSQFLREIEIRREAIHQSGLRRPFSSPCS